MMLIAACLPGNARDHLLSVQPAALAGTRLAAREELHLTLHFLGEITDEQSGAIRLALAKVSEPAFTITLRGIGQFPQEGALKVVWAGVEASPALIALHPLSALL